jgi:DNA adenine methylase
MGSMVVGLNLPNPKCSCIVNDLNKNIYSFFKVLQNPESFERLKAKLDLLFYSEDIFKESLEWLKEAGQQEGYSIEDRAYYFFVVNRMSFSGNNASFGKNMAIRRNTSKSVSDLLSTIDGLYEIHERIQKFIILNRDALDIIKNYDKPDYFFYLDSPYHFSTRTAARYPVDFSNEQQEEYVNLLVNGKAKYLVSGYDCDLYQDVLVNKGGWNKVEFTVHTISGANKPKDKQEVLWFNFNVTGI